MANYKTTDLPECPEKRRACMAYSGGHCKALNDTWFLKHRQCKKPCPFYKTKAMVAAQLGDRKETV